MTNTPIDRESVERFAHRARGCADIMRRYKAASIEASELSGFANTLLALRAALDAAEEENKRLREALEPFAKEADSRCADSPEWQDHIAVPAVLIIGDLRRARAALQENPDG